MGKRPRHRVVGHTADVGLEASAPDLPGLFEEAAAALSGIAADIDSTSATHLEPIELAADDLVGLAYSWLNELIGLAQARGEVLVGTKVRTVDLVGERWRLLGEAALAAFGAARSAGPRARVDVKSATFHRLAVRREDDGWSMTAYLDV